MVRCFRPSVLQSVTTETGSHAVAYLHSFENQVKCHRHIQASQYTQKHFTSNDRTKEKYINGTELISATISLTEH